MATVGPGGVRTRRARQHGRYVPDLSRVCRLTSMGRCARLVGGWSYRPVRRLGWPPITRMGYRTGGITLRKACTKPTRTACRSICHAGGFGRALGSGRVEVVTAPRQRETPVPTNRSHCGDALIRVQLVQKDNLWRGALAAMLSRGEDLSVVAESAGDDVLPMDRRQRPD